MIRKRNYPKDKSKIKRIFKIGQFLLKFKEQYYFLSDNTASEDCLKLVPWNISNSISVVTHVIKIACSSAYEKTIHI